MKKILSILLVAVMMLSVLSLTVAAGTTYSIAKDADGNLLNVVVWNNNPWVEKDGKLTMPFGTISNFLLFDTPIAENKIAATMIINDNIYGDGNHRNGLVFAFKDGAGDRKSDTPWDADNTYYWAFINDWDCVQVMKMPTWETISVANVDLNSIGINVKDGVVLGAEWTDAGNIKIYANGQLVEDITDPAPLKGDMYGMSVYKWGNTGDPGSEAYPYDAPVTAFVAGTLEAPKAPVTPDKPATPTPDTGDTTVLVSIIALVAAMGTGIVIGKKRSFN